MRRWTTPEKAHRIIGDDNDDDLFHLEGPAELSRNQMQGGVIGKITPKEDFCLRTIYQAVRSPMKVTTGITY